MGRSKESLKRKRLSRTKDSDHYAKRHNANYGINISNRVASSQTSVDNSTQSFSDALSYPQIPYYSWTTYFKSQEYSEDSVTVTKIDALIEFFKSQDLPSIMIYNENRVNLDINRCVNDSNLIQKWPNILQEFKTKPQYTLNCIKVALFETMMHRAKNEKISGVTKIFKTLQLNRINIVNYESIVTVVPCVKLMSYGKLISLRCRIISVGLPKFGGSSIVFACKCTRQIIAKRQNEIPSGPSKCNVCGNGNFTRLLESPYEIVNVVQTIRVKDYRPIDQIDDNGTISPNIVSVKIVGGLIEKFMLGDSIKVIGIPRITLDGTKSSTARSFPLYIDAVSIFEDDNDSSSINVNINAIEKIKSEPDVLSLLVHSLCPSVHGHEIIKAALILSLVGGTFENKEIRDSMHILIIGNLGLDKSQLLQACARVAPQGKYIRGSSKTNLFPTMINVRENGTEEYHLETGDLTMVNKGVCCIDELEKMSSQHQAISKFMEQQRVSVINSELKYEVPAHTSIFGMINPIKKLYDLSKTVVENVSASRHFLSRFDMIFLMRDNPDTYYDRLMSDRVFDVHTKRLCLEERTSSFDNKIESKSQATGASNSRESLVTDSVSDILPQKLLRMYISHARSRVQPKVSTNSQSIIEKFCWLRYLNDRENTSIEKLFRILVILIQARAKIDLRAETTERDAFDVIQILEHAVSVDMKDRSTLSSKNSGKLTGNKIKQFLDDLRNDAQLTNKRTFTTDELRNIAGKENVSGNTFSTLLSRLNEQGYLLKVSNNLYRVVFN